MAGVVLCQAAIANGIKTRHHTPKQKQIVLFPGSLKTNVENIARQYGWKRVVWNSPNDYRWITYTKIRHDRLQEVMRVVLVNYPLQAVFYEGNHVLLIKPRTLR
jgi:hypothetical protein